MYACAVIGWFSRYVVAWDLLPDMGAEGVAATMRRVFGEHGTPWVANSDQGSVLGSEEYVGLLRDAGVPQSMDGRGRWADNAVIVELEEVLGDGLHEVVGVLVDEALQPHDVPREREDRREVTVRMCLERVALEAHDAVGDHAAD